MKRQSKRKAVKGKTALIPRPAREIAEEHAAADRAMGRLWDSPQGCGCSACRSLKIPRMEDLDAVDKALQEANAGAVEHVLPLPDPVPFNRAAAVFGAASTTILLMVESGKTHATAEQLRREIRDIWSSKDQAFRDDVERVLLESFLRLFGFECV